MPIKAYKGFNKDMTCRGFQFEEGKTYEEPEAKLCASGFHACLSPLDCLTYYSPATSEFHEVELDDVSEERGKDSKVCAKKIKIGAKLDIAGICNVHFDFVKSNCTNENNAHKTVSAGYRGAASAGTSGAASAGASGAASAGDYGAASAGYRGAASAGTSGAASAGKYGAASAGASGAASAGESGAASAGNYGAAVSRGTASTDDNGLSVVRGNGCKAKGGIRSVIVIVNENDYNYDICEWKAGVIDGETLKADTWYKLENGEFVECEE